MRATRTLVRSISAFFALAAVLLIAKPAGAHVTVAPEEAPSDAYTVLTLSVPHGCGSAGTTELAVKLPDTFQSVAAEAIPGWEVEYTKADLDEPYELHGATVTEYVDTVTWTSKGEALPADQYKTFGLSIKTPDAAGEQFLLPVVQRCEDGSEEPWIDTDPASDNPAPTVLLVGATSHDGTTSDSTAGDNSGEDTADDTAVSDDTETDEDTAPDTQATTDDDTTDADSTSGEAAAETSSNGGSNTIAIIALIAALAGLGLGGYAVLGAKR